ncbi:FISUMP domain-containing protein [Saccharicrinis sp. FJH2]|uniref:FISUMP domain-containing protein n=1 Tax=Saccharicrinis sp. FJH65 TaxID=3344659 RepID=UPI0035F290E1
MKNYLILLTLLTLTVRNEAQTVTDVDGNVYNTITIGTQIWMKENLKTTKYNDGIAIPEDNTGFLRTPAFTWYNDSIQYKNPYGALYNWYVVQTGKLCPTGWHVPTNDEWMILETYLGGDSIAGGKLKESGLNHWNDPNTGADNSSGFTAIPGGMRFPGGEYFAIGNVVHMWSSTQSEINPWDISLSRNSYSLSRSDHSEMSCGYSVRCLNDNNVSSVYLTKESRVNNFYPNPAKDKLFIKYNNHPNTYIQMLDLQGKQVIYAHVCSDPIDLSSLHKGVYLVKIITSEKTIISKLIKE